jgi:hypothetical protein
MSTSSIATIQDLHQALLHGLILPTQNDFTDVSKFKRRTNLRYIYITDHPDNSKEFQLFILDVNGNEIANFPIPVTNTSLITDTEAIDQVFQAAVKEHNNENYYESHIESVFIFGSRIIQLVEDLGLPVVDGSSDQQILQSYFENGLYMTEGDYKQLINKHNTHSDSFDVMCFTQEALENLPSVLALPKKMFDNLEYEELIVSFEDRYMEDYGTDTSSTTQALTTFTSIHKNDISMLVFNEHGKLVKEYTKPVKGERIWNFKTLMENIIYAIFGIAAYIALLSKYNSFISNQRM